MLCLLPKSSSVNLQSFLYSSFLSASLGTRAFTAIAAWLLSASVGKQADDIAITCSQANHTGANYVVPKYCLINLVGWHHGVVSPAGDRGS